METTTVTCTLHYPDGTPLGDGTTIEAQLSHLEKSDGFVVPVVVSAIPVDGIATLELFPNELGSESSYYTISIKVGKRTISTIGTVVVPNADCDLWEIVELDPYPVRNAGDIITAEQIEAIEAAAAGIVPTILRASGSIGGSRIVCNTGGVATYADSSDVGTAHNISGISSNAATTGGDVTVITEGPITESSWSWIPGQPIYVSTNGLLAQTSPASGYVRKIGFAQSATTIIVQTFQPIILGG